MEPHTSCLIVDDEPNNRIVLHAMLRRQVPAIGIIFEAGTVAEAVAIIKQKKPQLVLLDVQLHNESGFDLLQQIDNRFFSVIFTTAHEHYAVKAFRFEAADYLLKPIVAAELKHAVEKALDNWKTMADNGLPLASQEYEYSTRTGRNHLIISMADGFHVVALEEIIYCEASGNYTIFHLVGMKKIISSQTLGHYEPQLVERQFFRSHRSVLLNLTHVKAYRRGEGGVAVMSNHDELEISRNRKTEFIRLFKADSA